MPTSTTPLPLADGTDAFVPAVPQKKVTGVFTNCWLFPIAITATAALPYSLHHLLPTGKSKQDYKRPGETGAGA